MSVLIIGDQERSRELIKQNLLRMGCEKFDFAASVIEAEEKMAAKAYDMVFVDWIMPGKSGYALLQEYRADRAYDHVAFIMVTNIAGEREMLVAMKAGATSYVVKPTMPTEFEPKIRSALEWMTKVNPRFSD